MLLLVMSRCSLSTVMGAPEAGARWCWRGAGDVVLLLVDMVVACGSCWETSTLLF